MQQFIIYWVWPNPAGWYYSDPKIIAFLSTAIALIVLSFALRVWRSNVRNPQTRILSSSWSSASFWFGISAIVLIVCRVELIQFLAMRLLWLFWFLILGVYVLFQILQFRRRHYTVVARTQVHDEREKYLPRKKGN